MYENNVGFYLVAMVDFAYTEQLTNFINCLSACAMKGKHEHGVLTNAHKEKEIIIQQTLLNFLKKQKVEKKVSVNFQSKRQQ
jgi:hypothetical protein